MKKNLNAADITWRDITSFHDLAVIEDDWCALNAICEKGNLFTSLLWNKVWIETYWQIHWHLKVLTAWQDQQLIAIVPLYYQQKNIFSLTTLYPLGQGEAEEKEISSEYLDIIIHPKHKSATISYITDWIKKSRCHQLVWQALNEKSTAFEILTSTKQNISTSEATRYLVNTQDWAMSHLSKNMRSRYRRGLNQLTKVDAKIGWVKTENIEQYWQIMKKFHQKRWLGKDKAGAFCSNEFNLFHKKFRQQAPDNITMSAIWINDAPVAIHYYFNDSTTLYFYQSGWDEDEYSHLSPSLILHLWGIEHNTKPFYDFMMGQKQDSYKAKFSPLQQPMHNIAINFNPKKIIISRMLKKISQQFTKINDNPHNIDLD